MWISILYTHIHCVRGGWVLWGSGPQTNKHLPCFTFSLVELNAVAPSHWLDWALSYLIGWTGIFPAYHWLLVFYWASHWSNFPLTFDMSWQEWMAEAPTLEFPRLSLALRIILSLSLVKIPAHLWRVMTGMDGWVPNTGIPRLSLALRILLSLSLVKFAAHLWHVMTGMDGWGPNSHHGCA